VSAPAGPFARPATSADPDDDLGQVLGIDLGDPMLYATERPERIWRTMRRAGAPLHLTGFRDHWAVTRYQQVKEVLRNSAKLSSEQGQRLGEKATDGAAGAAAGGTSMLVADDPAHAQMRRILEPAFSPTAVRRLAASTTGLARRLVADAAAQQSVEFVEALVAPLLTTVACDLVGIPDSDRGYLAELCQCAFSGSGYTTATTQITAHVELLGYCDELLMAKRRTPGDDAATALALAEIDGAPLPRAAAIMNCHDLILGGNASARYVVTSVPMTMLNQRPFWARLRGGDIDFAAATQELLRGEAPVNHIMRTLLGDLEIGGVQMRRGELVTLWLRSANRDESIFDDADRLRLDLRRHAHLTFGAGPHHCLAANLARLEIEALLRALAEQVRDAELTGPAVRMESAFLRGYRAVPIALHRR
jgi:cytochrome P450